jgi:hypothetical protein
VTPEICTLPRTPTAPAVADSVIDPRPLFAGQARRSITA